MEGKAYSYYWIIFWVSIMLLQFANGTFRAELLSADLERMFLMIFSIYGWFGLAIWAYMNRLTSRTLKLCSETCCYCANRISGEAPTRGELLADVEAEEVDNKVDQELRLDLVYLVTAGIRESALQSASKAKGYQGEAQEQKQFLHLYGQPYYSMKVVMKAFDPEPLGDNPNPAFVRCIDWISGRFVEPLLTWIFNCGKAPGVEAEDIFPMNSATFFDFAPEEFTKLRNSLNISVPEYVDSFKDHLPGDVLKEMGSTGKSGSIFYFTNNFKYIIKSIADHEMDTILSCVHDLCEHTCNNPNTLIHYYGAHAIELDQTMDGERQLMYFVVMKNLLDTSFIPRTLYPKVECYDTWDLKGALFLRRCLLVQR